MSCTLQSICFRRTEQDLETFAKCSLVAGQEDQQADPRTTSDQWSCPRPTSPSCPRKNPIQTILKHHSLWQDRTGGSARWRDPNNYRVLLPSKQCQSLKWNRNSTQLTTDFLKLSISCGCPSRPRTLTWQCIAATGWWWYKSSTIFHLYLIVEVDWTDGRSSVKLSWPKVLTQLCCCDQSWTILWRNGKRSSNPIQNFQTSQFTTQHLPTTAS